MRSTDHLIDALKAYEEALDAGCEIGPTEAYRLEEALASLQLKLTEVADRRDPAGDSQAGANAADHEGHPPTWPHYIDKS